MILEEIKYLITYMYLLKYYVVKCSLCYQLGKFFFKIDLIFLFEENVIINYLDLFKIWGVVYLFCFIFIYSFFKIKVCFMN